MLRNNFCNYHRIEMKSAVRIDIGGLNIILKFQLNRSKTF